VSLAISHSEAEASPEEPLDGPVTRRDTLRVVMRAFIASRLIVFAAGVYGTLQIGLAPGWSQFDKANVTTPSGYFGNLLLAPFARWDSVWYLIIAARGYRGQTERAAFFPLYPALIRLGHYVVGSYVLAGIMISLVSFAVALAFLYRLTAIDFGREVAAVAVALLAFFPYSLFFSAIYTESLFLALTVATIYYARTGRWAIAGVIGAFAAATRNTGVLLLVPLALMFLYGPRESTALASQWVTDHGWRRWVPRYKPTRKLLWLALVPVGLVAFLAYLWAVTGSPFTTLHVQGFWHRDTVGPILGIVDGIVDALNGVRQAVHGPGALFIAPGGATPLYNTAIDLMLFSFFLLAVVSIIGAIRRLPLAYSMYALASLLVPISTPVLRVPFNSLPRFELVMFPLFIWGADYLVRKRAVYVGIGMMASTLGLFTMLFATWRFIG
jgi:hypothetical protein